MTARGGGGLLRSSAVMSAGTVVSRATGVLRDAAMAAALGFGIVSDAFSLGNSLPNIVYILVIGGALNAVFVPQLVRRMKDDDDGGKAFADRLLTLVATVLLVLSAASVLAAPLIVGLYATDRYSPAQFDLAVAFARWCLPQIFFYGLYTMLSQVLNARGRFGAPMFAPIANNAVSIAVSVAFLATFGSGAAGGGSLDAGQVALLGAGTTAGVVAQALVLVPVLARAGYLWRPRFDWRGAGLGRAGGLAAWTVGAVLVNQAAYVVVTRLATLANANAAAGDHVAAGLTTYQKAHLIFILPHSVITVSVVTALMPGLSRKAHEGRLREVGADVGGAMRLVAAFVAPVAVVMVVASPRLAVLLFGYGAATAAEAAATGHVVSLFVVGLLPFSLFYVLLRGWWAMEDTRSAFWMTVVLNVANLSLAVPLFYRMPEGSQVDGLALGYALGYWATFLLAWRVLAVRLGGMDGAATLRTLVRVGVAGLLTLGVLSGVSALIARMGDTPGKVDDLLAVLVLGAVGAGVYLLAAWTMRIGEVSEALSLVTRRLPGRTSRPSPEE